MKKISLFLVLSLAANAAFLLTFFVRPLSGAAGRASPGLAVTSPAQSVRPVPPASVLAGATLAELKAAGLSDELARDWLVGRAYNKFQARLRLLRKGSGADLPFWRDPNLRFAAGNQSKELRAQMRQAQREYSDALHEATGDDFFGGDNRFNYLPFEKREQLRRISQDYSEMQSDIYSDMNAVQLPSDREKLRLLRLEQERDIAAALSPEELEQYNLRNSNSAGMLRGRFGDAIQSEDDYRKLFALQKAFDDQYSQPELFGAGAQSQDFMSARNAAETKMMENMRAALGEESFAAMRRALDQDYKTLNALVARLNLPPPVVDAVNASRDSYALQSQQINQDTSLSADERISRLKSLADQASAELTVSLGSEGAEAYAQRSNWLNSLKNGTAFSTNPKDAPKGSNSLNNSTFPVPPPSPPTPPHG